MAFPFETDEEKTIQETVTIPKEYEIDFNTGQMTGKIIEGAEAIKVWIRNTLGTTRYKHNIYTWDHGSELDDLIGHSYPQEYLEVEAKRMIEDCLLVNEYIISLDSFNVEIVDDKLSIYFTANTLFGEVNINV